MQHNPKLDSLRDAYERRHKDKDTKIQKLFKAFIDTLESGIWRPGDCMPTEKQLAEALEVSGGTIQSFMRELNEAGLVIRRKRVGTTIAQFDEKKGDNWYLRFYKEGSSDRLPVNSVYIEINECFERGPWSEFLGDCRSFVCIRRVMRIGEVFNVLAEFYLDGERFRPLLDYAAETIGNVHIRTILADRFRTPVDQVSESIYLAAGRDLPKSILQHLDKYDMIMEIKNFSLNETPVVYQRFYIPNNPFRLLVRNSRAKDLS